MDDETRRLVSHPLVDGLVEGGIVHHDPIHLLELTPSRIDLLLTAAREGRRVVLHTSSRARMSPALAQALRDVQGRWVVENAGGQLWDGLNGQAVDPSDPFGSDTGGATQVTPAAPAGDIEILFAASVRHRRDTAPTYGDALERFARELDAQPTSYGRCEPADRPWTRAALAAELAPSAAPRRLFVRGDSGAALRGSLLVRQTDKGTEEVIDVAIAAQPADTDLAARVHGALEQIVESSFVLAAVVLKRPGYADLMRRPERPAPASPLAMLLGPTGTRDLGADADDLAERFGVIRVGRPRTPSLLLPLHGESGDWQVVEEVVDSVGLERVEALLGWPLPSRPGN